MSRFRFTLDKVVIDPVSHLKLVKHANQNAHFKASGLIYGAMYDDIAEVTAVIPYPVSKPLIQQDDQKDQPQAPSIIPEERREQEDAENAKRKYEDTIPKFNLDEFRLGKYVVSYRKDFWNEIKNTRIMESKQKTSFLLVLNYSLLQSGSNPYTAYRLKRQYSEKQTYEWEEASTFDAVSNNPFVEIPVQVTKNTLFEALVQFNKQELIQSVRSDFTENKFIESEIQGFKTVIGNQVQRLQVETEIFIQSKDGANKRTGITTEQYNEFLNKSSTMHNYLADFRRYSSNVKEAKELFQQLSE